MPLAPTGEGDVTVTIARDPSLVRTVRLVAAAVARRHDCSDARIEEVRLAVGEACAAMLGAESAEASSGRHAADADDRVELRLEAGSSFTVVVTGRLGADDADLAEIGLEPWALLEGLSEDLTVTEDAGRTSVRLSWPL